VLFKDGAVLRAGQELGKVVLVRQHRLDGAQIAKDDRSHPGDLPEREEDQTEEVAQLRHACNIGWRTRAGMELFDCPTANVREGLQTRGLREAVLLFEHQNVLGCELSQQAILGLVPRTPVRDAVG
jgi:hypothetical protein